MRIYERPKNSRGHILRFVYFIQAGNDGPIKVGIAVDVDKRLRQLQCGCWLALRVLLIVPGTARDESDALRQLWKHRLYGEWLSPDTEVLDFIASKAKAAT